MSGIYDDVVPSFYVLPLKNTVQLGIDEHEHPPDCMNFERIIIGFEC